MKTYLQDADGREHTLLVTEPDPWDGTYCAHLNDESWIRIVPFLTTKEMFDLGAAYGSFSVGEIDQGIHLVLPVTDSATGVPSNEVFRDLSGMFEQIDPAVEDWSSIGELYMDAIVRWTKQHGIEIVP